MTLRIPQSPPSLAALAGKFRDPSRMGQFIAAAKTGAAAKQYLHWDKLRRYPPPNGLTQEEWWLGIKLSRFAAFKALPLVDKSGEPFRFVVPDFVLEALHDIDLGSGGTIGIPEPITNPHTRDRYLVSSLIEEAITSSQLEGAATTREVAKEMIRAAREPRDISERMILNNYRTMQRIREVRHEKLTPKLVFHIHRLVTDATLPDPGAAGRFRRPEERCVVADDFGEVYHDPPPAADLPARMAAMCAFANGSSPDYFVHPALRSIILHFWLAYDHPFVDGNGRTARALFYWAMLRSGYWLFEFISISNILRKAPARYARSFLYTETDESDLTYFIVAQIEVIRRAIRELHDYIDRKTGEMHEIEARMRALDLFNHRQVALIRHALKHPGHRYTIGSHRLSHSVVYQTARTDLLDLECRGILLRSRHGRKTAFIAPPDVGDRLMKLEQKVAAGAGLERSSRRSHV